MFIYFLLLQTHKNALLKMMPTCAICKVCSSWPPTAQCASPCAMRYVLAEAVMPTLLAGGGGGMPQPLDGGHSMPQPLDGGHSPGYY